MSNKIIFLILLLASFNAFLGDVKTYSLTGAYHAVKWNTSFGGHIQYVDYGSIPSTDAAGNNNGNNSTG